MELLNKVQEYLEVQQEKLQGELAAKYALPQDEADELRIAVTRYLDKTYGPAIDLARYICGRKGTVVLFIGREGCEICHDSQFGLDRFISEHGDVELVKVSYSDPAGLLYHLIHGDEGGLLPLIAMIRTGHLNMTFTGVRLLPEVYEKYYSSLSPVRCEGDMCVL
ncbi:MAG: hypothetical protein JW986_02505 [Methanotrichaceae archaeon]|nr:hypothetical protein [Methanotrichaceae archaeon]